MMENVFYFILKALFVLKIFAHILLNISRIKDNQTIKFGQLIEHSKRNFFFLKNYAENKVEN